ncbi:conserved hypothetical protein [Echinococcus multilocularis]|uniref:Uncharacterized protein n=1 Tax=Echinococcus multilocularis TaxID=6211 RepID=A0A068XTV2_ECHMU|nr:conserved hypothetical protein [Echinococcus multilocularis]
MAKNNKRRHKNACPPGVCHEAPQHRVNENQVSAHNKMGRESEWSTDAEYAYDEMTEFEQQPSKEHLNRINSNADDDLYDDLDAEKNSHAMESVVHKPIPKICDSKNKNIGNKLPNSVESSKSPSAKTNCRESSHEALRDGIPDKGSGDDEICMNEEIFKNLADPGRNDSPPPIPPKMRQITQTHNNGEKNSKKAHATGVLGLCAMKPGRGKKPARLKEAKTPQMNAETHAAEVFDGKIGTDVTNGEDEYEEYCYASELVDQPEIDQQVHLDKLLCNNGGLSMNGSMKVEKSSDMPPAVDWEEKLMDRHKNGPELQRNSEKMLQAPRVKQNDDVQKLSERRLPTPPIPLSESTTHIKPNVPMRTNSSVVKPCQSFPQIKQQRKEQIPKKPPKHNPPVSSTTRLNNQLPKSGTAHPHHGTKEDLVTMPSKAKANTDNSHDGLKSASQPKTAPRIPPRPQYIPQSLLLKLANSTEISEARKRPPTPEVTEQRTNQRGEQTNSGLVEMEKPGQNQPTTMKNQDATCSNEMASALECENDLYMQLEDCYG